jgi:predicted unusual protein kinase regulating ubiquinone biosynthesis (AarF/ABC1/UbiB family)
MNFHFVAFLPPRLAALRLSACFVLQIVQHGLFHRDLHSGHARRDRGREPRCLYDLGAVISLGTSPRRYFKDMIKALVTGNAGLVVESLANMGVLDLSNCKSESDKDVLIKATGALMEYLRNKQGQGAGAGMDIHEMFSIKEIFGRNQGRVPVFRPRSEFMYLMRNAGMVDATCTNDTHDADHASTRARYGSDEGDS